MYTIEWQSTLFYTAYIQEYMHNGTEKYIFDLK